MKKFGISMLIIFGFIVVFTVSGVVAFHSFPKNENKNQEEVNVGANVFSDESSYENTNSDSEFNIPDGVLTIITPSTDKSKTVVRQGTRDDIIIYEKVSYADNDIDVGQVESQNGVFVDDTPKETNQTDKKKTESDTKKEEKTEEPTEEKAPEEKETEVNKAAEEETPKEDEEEQKEVSEDDMEEEKKEEESPEEAEPEVKEQEKAPASQSVPPSMGGGTQGSQSSTLQLDPNKHYSDSGI